MSTAHNARTLGGVELESASDCLDAIGSGYSIQAVKFTLRKPEFMLSDLANPSRPVSMLSSADIQLYHELVRRALDAEGQELRSRLITGAGLNTEIALYGEDRESLLTEGRRIQERALHMFGLEQRLQIHNPFYARGIGKTRLLETLYAQTRAEYQALREELSPYYISEFQKYVNVFNLKCVYANHAIWQQLRQLGENFVFILNSGAAIYLSMVNATRPMPALFLEIHRQNDAYELFRRKNVDLLVRGEPDPAKSFVIIDIAYTGGSLLAARESIREHFGAHADVKTVGLFPKSYEAVKRLDYCVYAGRLIGVSERSFTPLNWHNELLFEHGVDDD
ncbi:phosphoribosyltransferase [Roseibium hamelinense]|nr:phosphoribosyltransferase [Roseibium hamelinense]MTI43206.1 phosphoribosyltransferase [Roseibium hamelinense]